MLQTENCAKTIWDYLQKNPQTMIHFTCVPNDGEVTGLITTRITEWYLDEENGILHGEGPGGRVVILTNNLVACEEKDGLMSAAYAGTYFNPEPDSVLWMFIFEPC